MADRARAVPQNLPGPWFVDDTCIDCGLCRWLAPDVFGDDADTSYVHAQPDDPAAAARAAVACPVGSIGGPAPAVREATRAFPLAVLPGVYACGWAQRETYGATAWFIERADGNVLVDVPRPMPALLDALEARGGVRWLFLTHRDDIHQHARFADRFGATRVMHEADAPSGIEHVVRGTKPVRLAPDLEVLPLPGHTRGSMALLWNDDVLFTGDHLWGRGPVGWHAEGDGALGAGRSVAWYAWSEQVRSMERLRDVRFGHVLPGHGRPWHGGQAARLPELDRLIAWMKTV